MSNTNSTSIEKKRFLLSNYFRTTIALLLMLVCPLAVILIWYTSVGYEGSLSKMLASMALATLLEIFPKPTAVACKIILIFIVMQAILIVLLPGKKYISPVTPAGNQVTYKDNGLLAWLITHLLLYIGAYQLKWFSPTIIYDNFGSILTFCSVGSLLFCCFLYVKGVWFPSSKDAGSSGNFIIDFFWGTELHPRILEFDLKQFINCRLGMMSWSLIILSFLAKQYEIYHYVSNSMLVAVILQLVYIGKFFWWESGYLATLDVMHDRFGFYICWGMTTWLPCVYTSQTLYLVNHPYELGMGYASCILFLGLIAIYINYNADAQRQRVRQTNGQCTVWGKPPEVIIAKYKTSDGEQRQNLLLVSGWWGISRHFHYIAEIASALFWTLLCQFDHVLPYFYVTYLTIFLVHRSFRDDERCQKKYGIYWEKYCVGVPYRILPGVF
jgi:7-dehydrocholesterol reductase